MEMPVYLFTGFLEAGKTKFLQETLADPNFNEGEKMLVILCEEGEEELDFSKMPFGGENITVVTYDEEQLLTPDRLGAAGKRAKATRVLVEYNGMWSIDSFYRALPQEWFVCEELTLMNAETILAYNANMRQLVFDKLQSSQMVIFNRVSDDTEIMSLHKLVRAVSRRAGIGYEYADGTFTPDNIEDPLPFDIDADVIEISDNDYAVWYAHLSENMEHYDGKRVSYLGVVARGDTMPKNIMAVGRQIMTCCADDISYRPLVSKYNGASAYQNGEWVRVTGKISIENSKYYQGKGPVLSVEKIERADAPASPVAEYY